MEDYVAEGYDDVTAQGMANADREDALRAAAGQIDITTGKPYEAPSPADVKVTEPTPELVPEIAKRKKAQDSAAINDAVAEHVAATPIVLHPVPTSVAGMTREVSVDESRKLVDDYIANDLKRRTEKEAALAEKEGREPNKLEPITFNEAVKRYTRKTYNGDPPDKAIQKAGARLSANKGTLAPLDYKPAAPKIVDTPYGQFTEGQLKNKRAVEATAKAKGISVEQAMIDARFKYLEDTYSYADGSGNRVYVKDVLKDEKAWADTERLLFGPVKTGFKQPAAKVTRIAEHDLNPENPYMRGHELGGNWIEAHNKMVITEREGKTKEEVDRLLYKYTKLSDDQQKAHEVVNARARETGQDPEEIMDTLAATQAAKIRQPVDLVRAKMFGSNRQAVTPKRGTAKPPVEPTPDITNPTPVGKHGTITPEQAQAREDIKDYANDLDASDSEAMDLAAQNAAQKSGEDWRIVREQMFGKDTDTPQVSMPNTTGAGEIDRAAVDAGVSPSSVAEKHVNDTAHQTGAELSPSATAATNGAVPTDVAYRPRPANAPDVLKTSDQWGQVKDAMDDAIAVHRGMSGEAARAAKIEHVMTSLRQARDDAIAVGRYPEMSHGDAVYAMHAIDMYEVMGPVKTRAMQFSLKPNTVQGAVGEGKFVTGGIPISSQMAATVKAIELADAGMTSGNAGRAAIAQAIHEANGTRSVISDGTASKFAKAFWDERDALKARSVENEIGLKTREAGIGNKAAQHVANKANEAMKSTRVGIGGKAEVLANLDRDVKTTVDALGGGPRAVLVGQARAADHLQGVNAADIADAKHIQDIGKQQANSAEWNTGKQSPGTDTQGRELNVQPQQQHNAKQRQQAAQGNATTQINQIHATANAAGVDTINELAGVTADTLWRRMYDGIASKIAGGYKMGMVWAVGRAAFSHFGAVAEDYAKLAGQVAKAHQLPDLQVAFEALRNSTGKAGLTVEQAAAHDALESMFENVLSHSKGVNSWGDTLMFRANLSPETINQVMHRHGITYSFRAKDNALEVPEQWREWTGIEDPVKFLLNMQHTQMELAARASVGRYFVKEFGHAAKGANDVKIARTQGTADLSHVIDTDLYYNREQAEWIARYSREIDKDTGFTNRLIKEWLDPYLAMYKTSTTVIRPGHQIRNGVGDVIMNSMDGVKSPIWYKKAAAVQMAAGDFKGDFKKLNELLGDTVPTPKGKAITVTLKNGKTVSLTNNQVYWYAHRSGLLLNYKAAEDILETTGAKGLTRAANAVNKNVIVRAAGKVTEASSDNTRLAHLLGLMGKKKVASQYDTVEEMFTGLTHRVQKFHPDVKGLTAFEKKYMRRIIPFYNWFKQAMPTLFMSTLTHPARTLEVPKAAYNLQVALGMDPHSMQDPFPTGSLYPDFIRNNLTGPMGLDGGGGGVFDFGSPVEAAGQIFNGKVGPHIADMLNPIISKPWGLIQGSHPMEPDHFIPDKGEWLDQAIPFANQFSNITGLSTTGSIGSLASGQGLDWQRVKASGEKDFLANQNLLNFMLGLNYQNTERQSFYNIARGQNQAYQEAKDPNIINKKRIQAGKDKIGLPGVTTGGLTE
jgi:hypothetical protein